MNEVIRMTKEGFMEVTNTKPKKPLKVGEKVLQAEVIGPEYLRSLLRLRGVYVHLRVLGSQ